MKKRSTDEILEIRRRHLGRNFSVSYSKPLKIVRGEGQYLYDEQGQRFLDLVNNVCHVGHCHPHVVAAGQRQMAMLNTNTRYLHDHLAEYAVKLTATFPDPLSVVFFVCTGSHFWAFEALDVAPDIVTLGKPIGNGHPMAAVLTTPEIAKSFVAGMEYFNTFGGNPVSCAIGLAVLEVIEGEGLQKHARVLGEQFLHGFREMVSRHRLVGDVRGLGLFLGVELVRDHENLEPADTEASAVIDAMCDRGFLLSTDGPLHNVIKIKPPMVFTSDDVAAVLENIDEALTEIEARG